MFRGMFEEQFFKIAYGIILVLIIIFLAGQIPYFMNPLSKVLTLVVFPILFGGFLYYLLRPLVRFLIGNIKNKNLAIIITFLIVIGLISAVIYFGGSVIYNEVRKLINYFSTNFGVTKENINQVINESGKLDFLANFNLQQRVVLFLQGVLNKLSQYNYMGVFSSLTNFGTIIILIPFVLFFFLKDDRAIYQSFLKLAPEKYKEYTEKILKDIDYILATYITSQLIVAFILGLIMFIGYMIIGIPNALALALLATVTSLIPILGPAIGVLPAVFIAITTNWWMILKLMIVVGLAQWLEGNLIRPVVQGEQLSIHPLIVIFLILISVMLFGILGALFAVPAYAVLRVVVRDLKEVKHQEERKKVEN